MSAGDGKYDISTATKLCTTLYRRIMSARCRRDCNESHCRVEMMENTLRLMRIKRRPTSNLAALRWNCSICLIWVCC